MPIKIILGKRGGMTLGGLIKVMVADFIAKTLISCTSDIFCKIHRIPLIHNRIIYNHKTPIEIGYCPKCQKEFCEYSDINPIYISNYEWLYEGDDTW